MAKAAQRKRRPVASSPPAEQETQPLARRQGTSLHHQVFLVLRDRIMSGQYEAGRMLPSEDELARMFSVSRVTIRASMATLEAEHLIERRQGVGTFVTATVAAARLHTSVSEVIEHIADIDRKTEIKLIEYDYVRAPFLIQSLFQCDGDAIFQRAVRLRLIGDQPIFHVTTFIPQALAKAFSREDLATTSLYHLLLRDGVHLHSGRQIVSAKLADPAVASLLQVSLGAPLLEIRRQHFDDQNRQVEYFEMLASPAMFELQMELDANILMK